jgi:hypothetical protein
LVKFQLATLVRAGRKRQRHPTVEETASNLPNKLIELQSVVALPK